MHVSEEPHPSSHFFRNSVAARSNFAGRTSLATACICCAPSGLLQAALEDIKAFFDVGEPISYGILAQGCVILMHRSLQL